MNNSFTPAEKKTEYQEVPEVDLSKLWLQLSDPSLLQDPETVAMQVASLTEWAGETLEDKEVLFRRLKTLELEVADMRTDLIQIKRLQGGVSVR